MSKVLAACLVLAAQTYAVPPAVLVGIQNVEGGRVGQQVQNNNGTYDLGPMQINTIWMPELADYWGVSTSTAHRWVRDDPCTNMGVAAWILRRHLNETGSLSRAIAHYHSKTPERGSAYRNKVVAAMRKRGLIQPPPAPGNMIVQARQTQTFGTLARKTTMAAMMKTKSAGLKASETRYAARNIIQVYNPLVREED